MSILRFLVNIQKLKFYISDTILHIVLDHIFSYLPQMYQPLTLSYVSNDVVQSHNDVTCVTWCDGHFEKFIYNVVYCDLNFIICNNIPWLSRHDLF